MTELVEQPTFIGLPSNWKRELLLVVPALGITLLSVSLLAGSEPDYLAGLRPWLKQGIWGGAGLSLALLVSFLPIRPLIQIAPLFYLGGLALILSLHWIGTEKGGAVSWVEIGMIRYQPSETMKIVCILVLARILCPLKNRVGTGSEGGSEVGFKESVYAVVVAVVPAALILLQPDLGTAMVFAGILLSALYGSRVPRRYITLVLVPLWALVALPAEVLTWIIWGCGVALWLILIAWRGETRWRLALFLVVHIFIVLLVVQGIKPLWTHLLKPHQRDRIVGFISRSEEETRELSPAAYHLRQSLIAISSGGLLGQGLGQGMQSSHGFIPMMRTDFIFAVLAEELGFIGAMGLFCLVLFLLLQSLRTVAQAGTWRESVVVFGILGMWVTHIFVNLGMTLGLMPITGIPFPFLSYGGSSLLTNYIALGLILSVSKHSRPAD
jgi:rod shape determining protein RodA